MKLAIWDPRLGSFHKHSSVTAIGPVLGVWDLPVSHPLYMLQGDRPDTEKETVLWREIHRGRAGLEAEFSV